MAKKQEAFMEAYQHCHEPFLRYCSALAYGKMDTEDLVQDVLLSAFQHFEQIQEKGQLLHYLIRAARNRSISIWRKSKFKAEWIESHANKLIAQGVSPEMTLDVELLYRTLNRLPLRQRDAIVLFEISGFSMKEIAEIQNSTVGAIKTKISRGRNRLKQLLAEKSIGNPSNQIFETIQTILL